MQQLNAKIKQNIKHKQQIALLMCEVMQKATQLVSAEATAHATLSAATLFRFHTTAFKEVQVVVEAYLQYYENDNIIALWEALATEREHYAPIATEKEARILLALDTAHPDSMLELTFAYDKVITYIEENNLIDTTVHYR